MATIIRGRTNGWLLIVKQVTAKYRGLSTPLRSGRDDVRLGLVRAVEMTWF
ncbi:MULTISPECIES: hypothetical protein [Acidobacteriaceae]|uniref:hypothetical protein n=1 Tax=Acidobacteriaceae TaxID=204434 RepID=UPI00131B1CFC|nr:MULTISPECIES: hypothetical protein [Acidobacteriaceae]MDW5264836.1 hypothetical protein [Edaphobacter sp.]